MWDLLNFSVPEQRWAVLQAAFGHLPVLGIEGPKVIMSLDISMPHLDTSHILKECFPYSRRCAGHQVYVKE